VTVLTQEGGPIHKAIHGGVLDGAADYDVGSGLGVEESARPPRRNDHMILDDRYGPASRLAKRERTEIGNRRRRWCLQHAHPRMRPSNLCSERLAAPISDEYLEVDVRSLPGKRRKTVHQVAEAVHRGNDDGERWFSHRRPVSAREHPPARADIRRPRRSTRP
jgi:hypothetical protein